MGWHKVDIDDEDWKELKKRVALMETSRSVVIGRLIKMLLKGKIKDFEVKK